MPERIYVAISLDVEEEGLFGGKYACRNVPVGNLASLHKLQPFLERGVRPTLFCAYPVFTSPLAQDYLQPILPYVEIGAHLHHWNTPPLTAAARKADHLSSVPAKELSGEQFAAKLQNVLTAGKSFCGRQLRSFRMGRWDLHQTMLPILAENGIYCDASVRPLHWRVDNAQGPDHFGAPADPYWIKTPKGKLLEVPLTVLPLLPVIASIRPQFLPALRQWGALALLAVYHPLWLLRLTTQIHIKRGGHFLSLTWHSSEMQGGATPHLATDEAVKAFLHKITMYLDWLEKNYAVTYVNMSQIHADLAQNLPTICGNADWNWPEYRNVC